jgi:signal transduction histidine kinase
MSDHRESLSMNLGRRFRRDEQQTASAVRWMAIVSLFLFIALLVASLLQQNQTQALVLSIGILPILISLWFLRRGDALLSSALLAINLVLFVTWLTTNGNGIYDAGIVAFPVILLIAGLILPEKFIAYLTALIIVCLGWLVFGDIWGLHQPHYPTNSQAQDFFIISVVILVASNSVFLLVRNVHLSLERAEQEIESRKAVEKQREALIHELQSKNQELNRFAITVSHDLKTPLITISGYLGYLQKDALSGNIDRMERDIAQINDSAKKMGRFVDQLLDLSRVGRIINPPSSVPFGEIVRDALKLAEGPIHARQVEVKVGSSFPVVQVDRMRMVQAMQNLISNSVKFMGDQEHPWINIGTKTIDGADAFFVGDNGIGISSEHQDGIFELFNKPDPGTEGIGIGLATVKRIIEVHGGRIWVESELGKGATFFFTLGKQAGQGA